MKSFSLSALVLLVVLVACFLLPTEGSYCPCDLTQKEQVCGTNGITYKNRCEFECTQRDYKVLGRKLNILKMGKC